MENFRASTIIFLKNNRKHYLIREKISRPQHFLIRILNKTSVVQKNSYTNNNLFSDTN